MTSQILWIPGVMPGLNDLISAAKGHGGRGYGYSKIKKQWTDTVILLARADRLHRVERATFNFIWHEKAKRRDPDNVAAGGRKLILDGLVAAGVLPGDGWQCVAGWVDRFQVSPRPGVLVEIEAV